MAVLVDDTTRVLIQGLTGTVGRQFCRRLLADGTAVVAGVVPGRGGETVDGVPVHDTVFAAREATGADVALVCTPAAHVADAVAESLAAGVPTVVVYTEGVATADALALCAHARAVGATLLGPASAGVVSPGLANVSDLRGDWLRRGPVGVVSRSGTLTYEVLAPLHEQGLGVSTVCCLGGDPVVGTTYAEVLARFETDPQTRAVVLLGEIGGVGEADAAATVAAMTTPVVAYVAGRHAPAGRPLGHAGALVTSPGERAEVKAQALAAAGALVAFDVLEVAGAIAGVLRRDGVAEVAP